MTAEKVGFIAGAKATLAGMLKGLRNLASPTLIFCLFPEGFCRPQTFFILNIVIAFQSAMLAAAHGKFFAGIN